MPKPATTPLISVIVPTRNRAALLRECLESLAHQTLATSQFEVVVVDDGSSDNTSLICRRAAARQNVHYLRIDPAGTSAAKNLGIFASRAPLLFFFDDDDIATPELLSRHLETHRAHPAEHVAVLGYTTWAPRLKVTPLMHYVMDVGGFLFCYGPMQHNQWLDFSHFWAGRSSCKRALLTQHGIFNQALASHEDVELGYRLSRFNLQIVHDRTAVQFMNRSLTYDDFCARCEGQGRGLLHFSQLHADPLIQDYCQTANVMERWRAMEPQLAGAVEHVHQLETAVNESDRRHALVEELHSLYRFTFEGFRLKGMAVAARRMQSAA